MPLSDHSLSRLFRLQQPGSVVSSVALSALTDCFLMIRFWLSGWLITFVPFMGDHLVPMPPLARFLLEVFKSILFQYKEDIISGMVFWDYVTFLFLSLSPLTSLIYIYYISDCKMIF